MTSYVESALINGEKVLYTGHLSLWSMTAPIVIGCLLLPFFGIGLIPLIGVLIRYKTTELAVTNKRIIAKSGLLQRSTMELNVNKVESIQVHQGIPGRLFGFGTLVISGAGNPQAPIAGISDPMSFRKATIEAQEKD